jgi:hypothetical protein
MPFGKQPTHYETCPRTGTWAVGAARCSKLRAPAPKFLNPRPCREFRMTVIITSAWADRGAEVVDEWPLRCYTKKVLRASSVLLVVWLCCNDRFCYST